MLRLALEYTQAFEFFYYPESRLCIIPERTQKHYGCKAHYADMPESFADDFVDDGSRDVFMAMYDRIHAGEKTASADFRGREKDIWCRVTLSTVTFSKGKPAYVVGIVEDVTREKTFELENTELHGIYDYLLNSDYDLLGVADLEKGRYSLRFSDKFDDRGMPLKGEIVQGNDWMLERFVHPDDRARMEHEWALETVISELEKNDSYAYYFRSDDDPPRYKEGKLSYFRGQKNRLLLTFRDIHDMRVKEERVRQTLTDALKVAEKANNAKSDFLSKMSHDMRTPMNGIIGLAMIAGQYRNDPERMKEYLTKISVASRHLLGLINDVLDMSKIEAGRIVLVEEDIDLVALLRDVVDIVMPEVKERQHAIRFEVDEKVSSLVKGDSLRLQQVFMNLLSNAVKFTPEGGHIGVSVSETASPFDGYGAYRFVFSDDGIGMAPEFMEKLFSPFEREENSMTSRVSGTGLGMPISKAIVEMMNGTIDVKSERGRGTVFTVTVHLKHRLSGKDASEGLEGMAVLVVDDDLDHAQKTVSAMEAAGLQAQKTGSAREALAMAVDAAERGKPYAALALDLKNPDMDGLELTRRLRLRLPDTTCIVMALPSGEDAWEAGEAGAKLAGVDVCLMRPVTPAGVVSALASLMKQPERKKEAATGTDFSGRRVLLVEDNELNLEIAAEILKMTHVAVETAEDGRQALEKVAASPEGHFDPVFMDIQMPVMDGYEATREIRALPRKDVKTMPIVAMTANAFPEDIRHAFDAGMNGHLAKPIELAALYGVMTLWLK